MIWRLLLGAMVGAGLGFGWHKLVGCRTGNCPLTAHPVAATLYGMVIGILIASSYR